MALFFDNSRPDRRKRAARASGGVDAATLEHSPVPPAKPHERLELWELYDGQHRTFVYDVECYPNFFCVTFMDVATDKVISFIRSPDEDFYPQHLTFIMLRNLIVGFNSIKYDMLIVMLALMGLPCFKLKEASDAIILEGKQPYEIERDYGVRPYNTMNHIDLIEVAPLKGGLKLYGGRLHCERMQDLPYRHDTFLTKEQAAHVVGYNINDLDVTKLLYLELLPYIQLRERIGQKYGQDLRSKSDAQIAEAVIKSELQNQGVFAKKPEFVEGLTNRYWAPDFIKFRSPGLQRVLDTILAADFGVKDNGTLDLPKNIEELQIPIGGSVYQFGGGGLHSTEANVAHTADGGTLLVDSDVASYYPRIILLLRLFPKHLGEAFLKVYEELVTRRLDAKAKAEACAKAGDVAGAKYWKLEADALKITINGAFGKLGSVFSLLYGPDLLLQVTITGQLSLLMKIEMIEDAGIPVVSANTDGIVMKCPAHMYETLKATIKAWEARTGFETEETQYKALYSRDVNNYIAIKLDGKCKTKGTYSEFGSALNSVLSKNPENLICSDAVQAFLSKGVPIKDTIEGCRDLRRFITVRNVKGGAQKDGVYLGKTVRWYYAMGETGGINRASGTGDQVPNSEGARPLMDMPAGCFPNNIDFDRYINKSEKMLYDLGYYQRPKVGRLF